MRTKRKSDRSIIVRLLAVGVSVYMAVTLIGLWSELREKQLQYDNYCEQLEQKQSKIEELEYLLEDGSQTALLEKAAREYLGYEYSDAVVYIDQSGS